MLIVKRSLLLRWKMKNASKVSKGSQVKIRTKEKNRLLIPTRQKKSSTAGSDLNTESIFSVSIKKHMTTELATISQV